MIWFLLVLFLFAPQTPTPDPNPLPGHGPWEGKGVVCWRHPTDMNFKPKPAVQCECKAPCDDSDAPSKLCMTKCDEKNSCVCHADECPVGGRH